MIVFAFELRERQIGRYGLTALAALGRELFHVTRLAILAIAARIGHCLFHAAQIGAARVAQIAVFVVVAIVECDAVRFDHVRAHDAFRAI